MANKSKTLTRAVRFSEEDNQIIAMFLEKNPAFDFSLLARIAILKFVENPIINLAPVSKNLMKEIEKIQEEDRVLLDALAEDKEEITASKKLG